MKTVRRRPRPLKNTNKTGIFCRLSRDSGAGIGHPARAISGRARSAALYDGWRRDPCQRVRRQGCREERAAFQRHSARPLTRWAVRAHPGRRPLWGRRSSRSTCCSPQLCPATRTPVSSPSFWRRTGSPTPRATRSSPSSDTASCASPTRWARRGHTRRTPGAPWAGAWRWPSSTPSPSAWRASRASGRRSRGSSPPRCSSGSTRCGPLRPRWPRSTAGTWHGRSARASPSPASSASSPRRMLQ